MNGVVKVIYRGHFHGADDVTDFKTFQCDAIINPGTFAYKTSAALAKFPLRTDDFNATVIEQVDYIPASKPNLEQITLYQDIELEVDFTSGLVAVAVN
jgi:hypothetical protein